MYDELIGRTEYELFPGIVWHRFDVRTDHAIDEHAPMKEALGISYCHAGRIGWKLNNGTSFFLGSGDILLHSHDLCADSRLSFPLNYCHGITIQVNLTEMERDFPEILRDAGITTQMIYDKFCAIGRAVIIPAMDKTDRILSECFECPKELRIAYYKLKIQELLIFLCKSEQVFTKEVPWCYSQHTETIREVHAFLTENLDQRYTIEELAKRFAMNTSTLKLVFKAVYGQPIAAYMKEYRIRKAMELLRTTDDSIADIAVQMGYRSQSRFSEAFKNVADILPTDYRKQI